MPATSTNLLNISKKQSTKKNSKKTNTPEYIMRKIKGKSCFSVRNRKSKRVFSKCANKENAIKQLKLLRAIRYNKTFRNKIYKKHT